MAIKIYSLMTFPHISDWNYKQLRKIDHKSRAFSFAVFGDNKNSITTFDNLIRLLNSDDILFSVDIGDLVQDGEREKFRFFINQIRKSKKPLLTVIGNHELREDGRGAYYNFFGRFYYSFAVGDAYFIILDDADEYNLDPWQEEWLKEELKKALEYRYRFVFMHVPLYDPRKEGIMLGHALKDKEFAGNLNAIFDKYRVTMVFASHIHAYYRGLWGRTPYIITGGGGAELVGTDPLHDFYHYIKVTIDDKGVSYEVKKVGSPDFDIIDRLAHDAWIYIYSFVVLHYLDVILIVLVIYFLLTVRAVKKERADRLKA
ncbi:MAG: metallophosphoesterase [Deferribacteres bacterium]|nr:metallophosphoesterase [Deferribacteres bacterium]